MSLLRIHREGFRILTGTIVLLVLVNLIAFYYLSSLQIVVGVISFVLFLLVLQFFRNPLREIVRQDDNTVYCPADGKVVTIEKIHEPEYFDDERIQVSIFMSPTNVHVNRYPVSGIINYFKYHPGKYLVAWHPKSSTENERTTTVIDNGEDEILMRQIAGFLAKRIVNYVNVGQNVVQGKDLGFIKFGSRVDLFLPLDTDIKVTVGQKVKGNKDIIALL